jgi:hypothetical protein
MIFLVFEKVFTTDGYIKVFTTDFDFIFFEYFGEFSFGEYTFGEVLADFAVSG